MPRGVADKLASAPQQGEGLALRTWYQTGMTPTRSAAWRAWSVHPQRCGGAEEHRCSGSGATEVSFSVRMAVWGTALLVAF